MKTALCRVCALLSQDDRIFRIGRLHSRGEASRRAGALPAVSGHRRDRRLDGRAATLLYEKGSWPIVIQRSIKRRIYELLT